MCRSVYRAAMSAWRHEPRMWAAESRKGSRRMRSPVGGPGEENVQQRGQRPSSRLPALVLYGLFIFRAYAAVQRECVRIFRISFFVANRTEEEAKYLLLMAGIDRGRSFWRALYIMSVCFACCLSGPGLGMSAEGQHSDCHDSYPVDLSGSQ